MKILLRSFIAISPLVLAGCAARSASNGNGFSVGEPREWPSTYQEMAVEAWLYAQMSENAYQRDTQFVLPDTVKPAEKIHDATGTGFGAVVYEVRASAQPDHLHRVVIAFRGTDNDTPLDWKYGNTGWTQNDEAEALYTRIRQRYGDVPITVTGHSLGGALALQVSTRNDSVPAYVFNSSYHIRNSRDAASERYGISEAWEAAGAIRGALGNPTILHHPYFHCQSGNPFHRHGITALAWCVTRVAAFTDSGAAASVTRNRAIEAKVEKSPASQRDTVRLELQTAQPR